MATVYRKMKMLRDSSMADIFLLRGTDTFSSFLKNPSPFPFPTDVRPKMGDPTLARSSNATTLRDKFELEKRHLSYADLHYEEVKNPPNLATSPSNRSQKQPVGSREMEKDEIVRNMSNLPSFLESGKATPDRALSFGVMDWGRLQNWKYQNLKQGPVRRNKCSPSSSNCSPLVSSSQVSRGQSRSPAHQKSHLNVFSDEIPSHLSSRSETKLKDCKIYISCPPIDIGNCQKKSPSLKGKMKIQDEGVNGPGNFHGNIETNAKDSVGVDHRISSENIHSYVNNNHSYMYNNTLSSYPLQVEHDSERNPSNASRLEEKRSSVSSKNSHVNMSTGVASKQRNMSPIRRFSFGLSSKSAASTTTAKRAESPVPRKSTADNSSVSNRSQSSPLRRLLEPLFPSKAANSRHSTDRSHHDSKSKAKTKPDVRSCSDNSHMNDTAESTSRTQALFETTVKNGRQMFTFAVENDQKILAATVRDLSSPGKDNNHWIYSFFTVDEIKKKKDGLFSQTRKDKGHGYVSNIVAQMKVSNRSISSCNTREFSLFHVDSNARPHDEVAAIVVKFSGNVDDEEDDQEIFSTTVILPGGNHGVSSKGKAPSPLIQRWLSGGVCDCGGWDLGCRLRTLTNQVQSSGRSNSTSDQFELFFQGDVINERRFFRLCVVKEGMFSLEYNSCLSSLEAFSICISIVECRKSCEHKESRTYVAKQVENDRNPVSFASFPPLSPVGRV
ncbi:hypothetical protein L6452_42787 [Arctium lappa]|uniref:Uncharacterized protein n=1 Tax=Arctium lappa TaxID=4217 RepID=A0ACB8XJ80_ARCLA|nr:hypothetical protein L6452_42787 [Arctium lappa]